MESSKNPHEDEIIKAIGELGKSPGYTELMSHLVNLKADMSEKTLKKYLKSMVNERKLFRTVDGKNTSYQVTPEFYQYMLPSDEEDVLKALRKMQDNMVIIEREFSKVNLRDKVIASISFYQTLRKLRTTHELLALKESTMKEPSKTALYVSVDSLLKSFQPIRNEMHELKDSLFDLISKDADGKTIQHLLHLKAVLLPDLPLDKLIRRYNRQLTKLEKKLKKGEPPMLFTNTDGKPLDAKTTPSMSYTLSLKKIPLK